MKQTRTWFFLALTFSLAAAGPAVAKISLDPSFEGTVVITRPDGEIELIEPGDTIPEIPTGSTLEVFDGTMMVSTEVGDKVTVSCLDNDAAVAGGASMNCQCGEESGLLKVVKGSVHLVDIAGKESELAEGAEYPIKLKELQAAAPAAAAGEPAGTPIEEGAPADVDSTSIQSSPS